MRLPTNKSEFVAVFCKLYIVLGLGCLAAGGYLQYVISVTSKSANAGLQPIAIFLFVFGILRIANSLRVLIGINRQSRKNEAVQKA